jgi:hypothetical protein
LTIVVAKALQSTGDDRVKLFLEDAMSVMREQCSSFLYAKNLRTIFKKLSTQWYSEDTIMDNTQVSDEEQNSEKDVFDFDKYDHDVTHMDIRSPSLKRKVSTVSIKKDLKPSLLSIHSQEVEDEDFDMEFTL